MGPQEYYRHGTLNVNRSNERKWLYTKKKQEITDADYADDKVLLENTPAKANSLLHSLDQAAGGIGLHWNADKTSRGGKILNSNLLNST